MILIALGSNLPGSAGPPLAMCRAALAALPARGVHVRAISPWYESRPVPASDQPNFINGVAEVVTRQAPAELLATLHAIEEAFGRMRATVNAARTLDLDLLDYDGRVNVDQAPLLPHPRLHERAFVLWPLRDIAPQWRHPVRGGSAAELIAGLPGGGQNPGIWPIPATS